MAPFAESVGAERDELLHDAEHRIADALGLLLQLGQVDVSMRQCRPISRAAASRDDPKPRLRTRQRGFDVEVIGGPPSSEKTLPHLRRAENVAEDDGVEHGCGHCGFAMRSKDDAGVAQVLVAVDQVHLTHPISQRSASRQSGGRTSPTGSAFRPPGTR